MKPACQLLVSCAPSAATGVIMLNSATGVIMLNSATGVIMLNSAVTDYAHNPCVKRTINLDFVIEGIGMWHTV
ncbi:hypothetical protein BDV98DRAFT_337387 [Pterulicium gracile]|uniref:Uncharacterized protein n=1 Tax=Pterulicium gracile TaxID=1884261 RepID=A0A5C3Q351_9AGAR|nr:hypothetical protein BDV98DRAFT_337387 [Pterula gracilis]